MKIKHGIMKEMRISNYEKYENNKNMNDMRIIKL